jgi:acyl-CoA thioesterase I
LLFAATAHSGSVLIVALGDSNTAGFGVGRENAFPARLEAMLRMSGYDVQVANAGISGDTLHGMLVRLDLYVPQGTRIVIVQGGYNDVMAGSSAAALLASINGILSRLAARRINTVLCGFYNQPGMPQAACWPGITARSSSMAASVMMLGTGAGTDCT